MQIKSIMFTSRRSVPLFMHAMKRSTPRKEEAFTIPELVTGFVIAGVVVTAGFSLSSMIQRSSREDLLSTTEISKTDVGLDQIVDEVNQSKRILVTLSELPSGCSAGGGNMFLAFQLPAQAHGKGDYQTQNTSTGAKTIAEQNSLLCPIVIGLKNPANGERGPRVLYRYGPGVDSKGFYQPTGVIPAQTLPILDGVNTGISGAPRTCRSGWTRLAMDGLEACIDPYRRTVEMSVSKVIPTATGALSRVVKRTAAGSTRSLDSSLIPVTDSSGGVGGTSFFGQYGPCDGTSFLLDNSGSMSWGNNRMEVAKRELMAAIDKCPDGAMINVLWFNSTYGAFSNTNTALNSSSRRSLNQFISNIYARGGTNPWNAMNALMTNPSVKRIVLLTDGDTWTNGSCIAGGGQMEYAECYARYNANNRPNDKVKIDTIALDTECNSGYGRWLSPLSSKTGGSCVKANT